MNELRGWEAMVGGMGQQVEEMVCTEALRQSSGNEKKLVWLKGAGPGLHMGHEGL